MTRLTSSTSFLVSRLKYIDMLIVSFTVGIPLITFFMNNLSIAYQLILSTIMSLQVLVMTAEYSYMTFGSPPIQVIALFNMHKINNSNVEVGE